jgi:hypothetical protein
LTKNGTKKQGEKKQAGHRGAVLAGWQRRKAPQEG